MKVWLPFVILVSACVTTGTYNRKAKVLAAAGYGEFDPVAPNDTAEHRAQNRRIEIVLQPNLSDLPPLDEATATTVGSGSPPKNRGAGPGRRDHRRPPGRSPSVSWPHRVPR